MTNSHYSINDLALELLQIKGDLSTIAAALECGNDPVTILDSLIKLDYIKDHQNKPLLGHQDARL